jgi:hypothetical protein
MARTRNNALPKYPRNQTYYYKNPAMPDKARLGKLEQEAVRLASQLNSRYRIQCEQEAARLEASVNLGSVSFAEAFGAFVEKYVSDYSLKSSTTRLLYQRRQRLTDALGKIQVPMVDTQMLREAILMGSQFEQSKLKTLLLRFFRYAKSTGIYPSHLGNPVDDLFVDPCESAGVPLSCTASRIGERGAPPARWKEDAWSTPLRCFPITHQRPSTKPGIWPATRLDCSTA